MAGFGFNSGTVLLCLVLAAIEGYLFCRRKRLRKKQSPPQGIVLLLSEHRPLNVHALGQFLGEETGLAVQPTEGAGQVQQEATGDPPGKDFVMGRPPQFASVINKVFFLIHNRPQAYWQDSERFFSEQFPDLRIRKAIRENTAWISVDILHDQSVTAENYRIVGLLVSRLFDSDCMALYHPPSGRFALPSDQTVAQLRSDDPVEQVFESPSHLPVIPIDDDPRLKAAEQEARRRLREFEQAIIDKRGQHFSVKAAVTCGSQTEHIWIEIESIVDDRIQGRLANEPADLGPMKLGDRVVVDRDKVEDWAYQDGENTVGAFTAEIVYRIGEEIAAKRR
jgi:uncharacterized protein YegJ (DUF2314 family)